MAVSESDFETLYPQITQISQITQRGKAAAQRNHPLPPLPEAVKKWVKRGFFRKIFQ
jgi:hypothetical protein